MKSRRKYATKMFKYLRNSKKSSTFGPPDYITPSRVTVSPINGDT